MRSDKTIEVVVKQELCTGCGTCVSMCLEDAIEMVINHSKGIYVPQLDNDRCNECGICFDVCPGHSLDFKGLNVEIFGEEPEDILLGNYLNCYIAHGTDYDIRYNCASGGLVTTLLIFALEEGLIDGALVTKMREDRPLEPQPFIAKTRGEIISAAKSKYCPVPANIALKELLKQDGAFAVVGLSCHIHGIRKAELLDNKLKEKIVLHLGILCSAAPTFLATEFTLKKAKVRKDEVKGLDYRGEGWPGKMRIRLRDNEILLPFHDYWNRGFSSYFFSKRCRLCCDGINEFADISFGDAWRLPEVAEDKAGASLLVSRSKAGEEILRNAESQGKIELKRVESDKVLQSQRAMLLGKKSAVGANLFAFKLFGSKVPTYNLQLLKPKRSAYLRAVLYYLYWRLNIASKRLLWRLI